MTGTPGTGKTTIAKILSNELDAKHIELSVYAKENGLIIEDDPDRDTQIVDIDALSMALEEIVKNSYQSIIIDGHYSHSILDVQLVSIVIILRKAPWELLEVLQKRLYSNDKLWENLEAEIMGVISEEVQEYPSEKLHEVNTTNKTQIETAEEIIEVIRGKKPKNHGAIDWIIYPETLRLLMKRTCTLS